MTWLTYSLLRRVIKNSVGLDPDPNRLEFVQ